jgi:phosphate-selective porin
MAVWPESAEAQTETQPTQVDASSGGVTFSSGVNSLSIGARVQVRWAVDHREDSDTDTDGIGVGRSDGSLSQFDVPRMRVTFSGGAFRPWLKYLFQFDFSRTSGEGDSKIKDATLEVRPVGRPYRIVLGQFKVPFSLQQLTSSGRQQFVDRAITDNKFAPARDMGAVVAGAAASQHLGYEVGLFNGSGESIRQNNRAHLWVARVFVNPTGIYSLSEGSSDAPERPVYHVGMAVRGGKQIRGRTAAATIEEPDNQTAFDVELAVKSRRVYSTAEFYWMADEQQNPTAGPTIDSRGFHVQGGVTVMPVELALRYARISGDTALDDAELTEWRAGVDYYWRAHSLKLQADVGQVSYGANYAALSPKARSGLPALGPRLTNGRALSDTQVRMQFQLAF